MNKKQRGLNPELEEAVSKLLRQVMADETASLTDKTKVLDRALKLEQIKMRMIDDEYGSGFYSTDDDE